MSEGCLLILVLQEYEERRHLSYQDDLNQRRKEKRMVVADERRRWQVYSYVPYSSLSNFLGAVGTVLH